MGSASQGRAAGGQGSIGAGLLGLILAAALSIYVAAATSLTHPSSSTSTVRWHPLPAFLRTTPAPSLLPQKLHQCPLRSQTVNVETRTPSWERLRELVEAALAANGDGIGGAGGGDMMDRGAGPSSVSAADMVLVEALEGMKQQQGEGNGALRFFNSVRLEPYRASRADLAVYARMQEKVEVCLGFTSSPAVERIEAGIAIVMAFTVLASITSLDKLTNVVPDIVRWAITAGLVSLPFAYIVVGVAIPDALIALVNQVLFSVNREYKERIYRHEAGHFLAGYIVGLPVLQYSVSGRLSAVQFAQVLGGIGGLGAGAASGPMPREQADSMTPRGVLSKEELAKLAVVSLAGVVSEYVRFGKAEGGFQDLVQLQRLLDLAGEMDDKESQGLINYGVIQAYTVIKANEKALVELMAALEEKRGVVECMQIIEQFGGRYLDEDD